ncbi:uncharacterized protein LOC111630885, partial [Centruroides sculpturatus]|uniref:uncharacterized protein LOC111630885 n=1 Tax=Centruroides sculpturatus TaxID=218467 RepID=UPI000C6CD4AC
MFDYAQLIPPTIAAIKNTCCPELQPKLELSAITNIASKRSSKSSKSNAQTAMVVKSYLTSNHLNLLVANKDKRFVLCKNQDFLSRSNEFLQQSESITLKDDPTPTILRKTRKIIALTGVTASLTGSLNPPVNIACPRLFFEVKTHKPDWPLRPLINKRSHPTYFLETALAKHLSALVPPSNLVTNAVLNAKANIVATLGSLPTNSYRLYKIDVISLYPSVPHFEAVMLANALLLSSGHPILHVLHLREALLFITENNYFQFNGKIYKQTQGVPMGSPLSPILAELIMRNIENRIFHAPLTIHYPIMYLQYVDDILIAWDSSAEDLDKFIQMLASIYPTINFTVEEEQENTISFLDLEVHRYPELTFAVHHKNNRGPDIIPVTAFQPPSFVNSAITSLIRRALLIPSFQTLIDEELQINKRAMHNAGYSNSKYQYLYNL